MRVSFVGKGGSGKSTVAGTFARLLARSGAPVAALDSDPMPGLSYALGIPVDDAPLPEDLVDPGPADGPEWILKPGLDPVALVDSHSVHTSDGVRYFQYGNSRGTWGTLSKAQHAWSAVVKELPQSGWNLVGDLPGGLRQAMNGWGKYADVAIVVTEPTAKGAATASQLVKLTRAEWGPREMRLVVNKVMEGDDVADIVARVGIPLLGTVPWSLAVRDAERLGRSPLDHPGTDAFVAAVATLVEAAQTI